jgi:hypothetical protein
MLYELIRTVIQKILQDKILLGLVIVAILGIFVGGMTMGDDDKSDASKKNATAATEKGAQPQQVLSPLNPTLAADFVRWWLGSAMDYNASSAQQSHNQAFSWMTVDAARAFQANFWTPQIAEAVASGRLVAGFQPVDVQAQAINPDGSVVVGVAGTMIIQANGQPAPQPFSACFLVRQEKDGLRVAGLDARTSAIPGGSIY